MDLPSENQIYDLHKEACPADKPKLLENVWMHSVIVKDIALQCIEYIQKQNIEINKDLVIVGALVHDIGVYECWGGAQETLNPYIQHGERGERILLEKKYPYIIARFASHHTGVGIVIEEFEYRDLPIKKGDWIPVTFEEEVVAYADKFHSKDPKFNTYEEMKKEIESYYKDNAAVFERLKKKCGLPNFEKLNQQYGKWHAEFHW